MPGEAGMESLREVEERLDFRRDLMGCSPESFTSEQYGDLLREQKGLYDKMDDSVREDFKGRSPLFRKLLLESLDGAGGHDRTWWEGYLSGSDSGSREIDAR